MDEKIAFYSAIVVLIGNIVVLITQLYKFSRLNKSLSRTTHIYNVSDLKKSLEKPFEGVWQVCGIFEKYQGVGKRHRSSGFATFVWNESQNVYDVYYTYSTEKDNDNIDMVTAICTGQARDVNGGQKIKLTMRINNRTILGDIHPNSQYFDLVSKKILVIDGKIIEIKFLFDTVNTKGEICFRR